jgi:hypothetical protein
MFFETINKIKNSKSKIRNRIQYVGEKGRNIDYSNSIVNNDGDIIKEL